jgi:hypothetical protein
MFYDIKRVNYAQLIDSVSKTKPYAGTTNVYPLGAREYSDRHMRLQEDGSFVCFYSNRKQVDEISKGQKEEKSWHKKFATIYPDNTIEFERPTNHMGENMILRRMLGGNVCHEQARGGMVFKFHQSADKVVMHPIFNGLRVNLSTQESTVPYILNIKKLNQKKAKEYLAQYGNFRNIAKVMIDPMSDEGIRETLMDLKEEFKDSIYIMPKTLVVKLLDQRRVVDAAVMFASVENINYINWSHSNMSLGKIFKDNLFDKINNKFNEVVLQGTDIPFILEPHEGGKYFPTSKWGYTIVQNNEVKTRY